MERASGVVLHISSLPNQFGIGSFGASAYEFVDFLVKTKQQYWQILPLTTTSYGDSPYQSFSAFAGNTHFIDFDLLAKQGYLDKTDYQGVNFGNNPKKVAYNRSEEHTSELQSRFDLVCRLLLEKKKKSKYRTIRRSH